MASEVDQVISYKFVQFFELFQKENLHNWDNATCILALVHWITLENGYVLVQPANGSSSTAKLDYLSNQIKTTRDGSRVGVFMYMHKKTGLKKFFEFHETNTNGSILISFVWKDNKYDENNVSFYDKKLLIHSFVRDLNREHPVHVYQYSHIWMLSTMIKLGLISERHTKKTFIMNAEAAASSEYERNYFRYLLQLDYSNYFVLTDLEYLERWWALGEFNSPLRFVVIHIHKVLVNYNSEFMLCKQEEYPTKAWIYNQSNGKRILEAVYASRTSCVVKKLRIVETETDGTGDGVTIHFGCQMIKLDEKEYVRNDEVDWENLWKLSAKIRVHLICERSMDKLKELIGSYISVETHDKKCFVRDLLMQFKATLEAQMPLIDSWRYQLLEIDTASTFKESTIFSILFAECIISEGGTEGYEMLRKAWEVETLGAFHLVAVFIHLALMSHPKKLKLRTTTGVDNIERIVASSSYNGNTGTRTLEAEYEIPESGIVKKLMVMEGVKDQLFCAALGDTWVPFYVADLVSGYEWKINTDNDWNRWELTNEVKKVLAELDFKNSSEDGNMSVTNLYVQKYDSSLSI